LQRYGWLATRAGHEEAFARGRSAGRRQAAIERWTHRRHRLKPAVFESFFQWQAIEQHLRALADSAVHRIVLADLGKNVFAFHRAAQLCHVEVLAVADDVFSAPLREYRGVPVLPLNQALSLEPDAVVVSNTAAVFAEATFRKVSSRTTRPVFHWFAKTAAASALECVS